MNNTKVKSKILLGILLLLVALCVIAGTIPIQPTYAQSAAGSVSGLTENEYVLTNTDTPNGIYIGYYAATYYGANASMRHNVVTVLGDDDIVKIIPKELFGKEGIVQHVGKEYGFFIETKRTRKDGDQLVSSVIIMDVANENDMYSETSISHLKIKVSPIFQADFAYVVRGTQMLPALIRGNEKFFNDGYVSNVPVNYSAEGSDFVVPIPSHRGDTAGECTYQQHNKYFLTNVSNQTSLYNVNQPNPYDYDYDAMEDTGCFFSQMDFNYDGRFLQKGKTSAKDVGSIAYNAASLAFDFYDKVSGLKSVFKAVPVLGALVTTADMIASIARIQDSLTYHEVSESKKITYEPYYNNKEQQIAKFGELRKDAACAITSSDPDVQLLFGTGDYFEFDYQIHCQDIRVDTRYATMINIGVMSVTSTRLGVYENTVFGEIHESTSAYSDFLKNHTDKDYREIPRLEIDRSSVQGELNMLPNCGRMVQLSPTYSGYYDIAIDNPYSKFELYEVSLLENGILNYNDKSNLRCASQKIDGVSRGDRVYLEREKNYLLIADMQGAVDVDRVYGRYGTIPLEVRLVTKKIALGEQTIDLDVKNDFLRFDCIRSLHHRFSLGNESDSLWLMNENFEILGTSSGGELLALLNENQTYLLRLETSGDVPDNLKVSVKDEMYVTFDNIDDLTNVIPRQMTVSSVGANDLPVPQKKGKTFDGWQTQFGQTVDASNITDFLRPTLTLYAQWTSIVYPIYYEENGGEAIPDGTYVIDYVKDLDQNIRRSGYVFCGWYDNVALEGEAIVSLPQGSTGERKFFAKWVKETLRVTLDVNAAYTDGAAARIEAVEQNVRFGQSYQLPIPVLDGFIFEGWYWIDQPTLDEGKAIKLTDGSGKSYVPFDREEDVTVTAKWSREKYYIQIDADGRFMWLKQDESGFSFSADKTAVENKIGFCPNCYISDEIRKGGSYAESIKRYLYREGHRFNEMVRIENGVVIGPACWQGKEFGQTHRNEETITIYADYTVEKNHKIFIQDNKGAFSTIIYKDYGMPLDNDRFPAKEGMTFDHFVVSDRAENACFANTQLAAGKRFDYSTMPDLTIGKEEDGGAIFLTPIFIPNQYTVTFADAAPVPAPKRVTYGAAYNLRNGNAFPVLAKTGYDFKGWYTQPNGGGVQKVDASGAINQWDIASDCTLYAHWSVQHYDIIFDRQGGSFGPSQTIATYGQKLPLFMTHPEMEKTNSNEYLKYMDIASIIDSYGLVPYTISFDIKSKVAGSVYVYQQNGSGSKYFFGVDIDVTTSYTRQKVTVTPHVADASLSESWLAFYGTYGTGKIVSVKNVKIELGTTATDWNASEILPQKKGYAFQGYYSEPNGKGTKYYDSLMTGVTEWTPTRGATLYAYWQANEYTLTLDPQNGQAMQTHSFLYQQEPKLTAPTRQYYDFAGYFTQPNGQGVQYYDSSMKLLKPLDSDLKLYANWNLVYYQFPIQTILSDKTELKLVTRYYLSVNDSYAITAPEMEGCTFSMWRNGSVDDDRNWTVFSKEKTIVLSGKMYNPAPGKNIYTAVYEKNCVAEGSLITLADGSQKAVEELTGEEELLVWNLFTGTFDTAPILFIDSDPIREYEVIKLLFSDGTEVKVISEHAFWDFDLNQYVFLRRDADQYVGHWFNRQATDPDGNLIWTKVRLESVVLERETTTAWSPVTYGHLCYYVNGMLSMPGATQGLINIFDVDPDTMKIDQDAYLADIEKYGVFTYEEFAAIYAVPRTVFEAFGGQYFKVAMGKGLLSDRTLRSLIEHYSSFFETLG